MALQWVYLLNLFLSSIPQNMVWAVCYSTCIFIDAMVKWHFRKLLFNWILIKNFGYTHSTQSVGDRQPIEVIWWDPNTCRGPLLLSQYPRRKSYLNYCLDIVINVINNIRIQIEIRTAIKNIYTLIRLQCVLTAWQTTDQQETTSSTETDFISP